MADLQDNNTARKTQVSFLCLSPENLPFTSISRARPDEQNHNFEDAVTGRKDRRRTVRLAWEKLLRWSRSWQSLNSRAKMDVLERTKKVVVLGGGSFGTAMAAHLAEKKSEMEVNMLIRDAGVCQSINKCHLNSKYLSEYKLPENVVATTNAKDALLGADFCLHTIPVQFSSSFLKGISLHVDPKMPFISESKRLALNTLRTMSQIIPQSLGNPSQPVIA